MTGPEPRKGHRCCCVLTDPYLTGRCPHEAGPDSPFCPDCEARHPEAAAMGVRVEAVMVP